MVSHVINGDEDSALLPSGFLNKIIKLDFAGAINRKMDNKMAGVASVLPGPPRASDHPVKKPGDLHKKQLGNLSIHLFDQSYFT